MSSGILPVTVGFLLGLIPEALVRRTKKREALVAIKAEIKYCVDLASQCLSGSDVGFPLRYPIIIFQHSFPALLDSKRVDIKLINAITDYYCHIIALNGSLDSLESHRPNTKNHGILQKTIKQLTHKCSTDHDMTKKLLTALEKITTKRFT